MSRHGNRPGDRGRNRPTLGNPVVELTHTGGHDAPYHTTMAGDLHRLTALDPSQHTRCVLVQLTYWNLAHERQCTTGVGHAGPDSPSHTLNRNSTTAVTRRDHAARAPRRRARR